ncbi:DNA damage-inducible transcript 4-like protein [Aplochiton taeniatus]
MVYIAAPVFGQGKSVKIEEESVVDMMRKFLFQITSSNKYDSRRGSVESCDELRSEKNYSTDDFDTGLEYREILLQRDISRQIESCLIAAKGSSLRCQVLLVPNQMSAKVARDVMRSSADEPCGIRGASIQVCLEKDGAVLLLGTIIPDSSITSTFELSVVFKVDNDCWPPLKRIFVTDKVLKLRPQYRLVKKKLYSSASPIINDYYSK